MSAEHRSIQRDTWAPSGVSQRTSDPDRPTKSTSRHAPDHNVAVREFTKLRKPPVRSRTDMRSGAWPRSNPALIFIDALLDNQAGRAALILQQLCNVSLYQLGCDRTARKNFVGFRRPWMF